MNPYAADDRIVGAIHAECQKLLGPQAPSLSSFVATLNWADELSTTLYEGEALTGSLVLLGRNTQLHPFRVAITGASRESLRALLAAAGAGEIVVHDMAQMPVIVGLDFPGYGTAEGVHFRFRVHNHVFVSAAGVVLGVSTGTGLTHTEVPFPDPRRVLQPALVGRLTEYRLLDVLRAVLAAGSGGIIVISPDGTHGGQPLCGVNEPWLLGSRAAELLAPAGQDQFFRDIGVQRPNADQRRRLIESEGARLANVLRGFGGLARADGAIIIGQNLELIAFGQRLADAQLPERVLVEYVIAPSVAVAAESSPNELGGTRTQAAIAYVHAHPASVAFVVSADGPVSMMVAKEGFVVVTRGIEAFL